MKTQKPTLEEFCQIYPELPAQAREHAEGTFLTKCEYNLLFYHMMNYVIFVHHFERHEILYQKAGMDLMKVTHATDDFD